MTTLAPTRRLRRLRRWLAFLAAGTAILIAAACRLESTARAAAAVAALGCLVAWVVVLDLEGRLADRLEHRGSRRRAPSRAPTPHRGTATRASRRRAA